MQLVSQLQLYYICFPLVVILTGFSYYNNENQVPVAFWNVYLEYLTFKLSLAKSLTDLNKKEHKAINNTYSKHAFPSQVLLIKAAKENKDKMNHA